MGSDTLTSRTNGETIDQTWFNVPRAAMIGDWLPRNASGSVESIAGNLGSDTYRWHNAYIVGSGDVNVGTSKLQEASSKLCVTDSGGNQFAISEIVTSLIGAAADNSTDLGTFIGSIIADSSDVKTALQALETSQESVNVDWKRRVAIASHSRTAGNGTDYGSNVTIYAPTGKIFAFIDYDHQGGHSAGSYPQVNSSSMSTLAGLTGYSYASATSGFSGIYYKSASTGNNSCRMGITHSGGYGPTYNRGFFIGL